MKNFILVGSGKNLNQAVLETCQKLLKTNSIKSHPDIIQIKPEPSIGISQIRKLVHFLNQKPFKSKQKGAVVHQADQATQPAQNALLKTLEEPPENSFVILTSQNSNQLLPTIISRCQVINLKTEPQSLKNSQKILQFNQKIFRASKGKRLVLIEPFLKNRQTANRFVDKQIQFWRQVLIKPENWPNFKPKSSRVRKIISLLTEAKLDLNRNLNIRICLDNLVLAW